MIGYVACVAKLSNGKNRSIYQHREVMESHLGRKLTTNEVVHHLDHNRSNNRFENLELMTRAEHARLHGLERVPELHIFTCPMCEQPAIKLARNVRSNKKKNRSGPFCSRSCAGKYGKKQQCGVSTTTMVYLTCPQCKNAFSKPKYRLTDSLKRGRKNIFCSLYCCTLHKTN